MIDFQKIKTIYKLGKSLSFSDAQHLINAAKSKSFSPGDHLIKQGSLITEVFFIRKGLVRAFTIDEKGNEITTLLRWENQFFTSPQIILFNQPSKFFYEAIEPTEVFSMDFEKLQTVISANPKLEANRKYILRNLLKEAFHRIDSFILLSPEERYIQFVEKNPDIVKRVHNKYIAHVLGITPVSLSRIRKRIATRKK